MAGLLLLPGRLLGPDQPVHVAVPPAQTAHSVQAAPPLAIRHVRKTASKFAPKAPTLSAAPARLTYVARPRTVVRVSPARKLVKAHRSAVIRKLAPTAPLVRARLLATVSVPRRSATPKATAKTTATATATAKTIAGLAASLRKK